jgi:non-homologous end joining protein Ku
MDILQFVGSDEVDPIYFESSYYVAADDKIAKPYVLFMDALADTRQDAIAKVTMHNREHIVLIRPTDGGLILHTLFYPNELHKADLMEALRRSLESSASAASARKRTSGNVRRKRPGGAGLHSRYRRKRSPEWSRAGNSELTPFPRHRSASDQCCNGWS